MRTPIAHLTSFSEGYPLASSIAFHLATRGFKIQNQSVHLLFVPAPRYNTSKSAQTSRKDPQILSNHKENLTDASGSLECNRLDCCAKHCSHGSRHGKISMICIPSPPCTATSRLFDVAIRYRKHLSRIIPKKAPENELPKAVAVPCSFLQLVELLAEKSLDFLLDELR